MIEPKVRREGEKVIASFRMREGPMLRGFRDSVVQGKRGCYQVSKPGGTVALMVESLNDLYPDWRWQLDRMLWRNRKKIERGWSRGKEYGIDLTHRRGCCVPEFGGECECDVLTELIEVAAGHWRPEDVWQDGFLHYGFFPDLGSIAWSPGFHWDNWDSPLKPRHG
jgi:hypothetical protein